MFATATILIDRKPEDVYAVLADFKLQLPFWELFFTPELKELDTSVTVVNATFQFGRSVYPCEVAIHLTRPGAGLVTRVQFAAGELAAEWRIMEEGERTRIEVNIEGEGGGPASNINIRQMAPRILMRLKQHFDKS